MTKTTVNGIELPMALFGCQDGLGVYAASDTATATPSTVTMTKVVVTNYDKNGITCDDVGTQCTISTSTVTGIGPTGATAQNGIQGFLASSVIVSGTKVSGNSYTGPTYSATNMLFIDDAQTGVASSKATAGDVGIFVLFDSSDLGGDSTVITGNTANSATGSFGDGIDVDGSSAGGSTTVDQNITNTNPEFGVGLFDVQHDCRRRSANDNTDGIFAGQRRGTASTTWRGPVLAPTNSDDGTLADAQQQRTRSTRVLALIQQRQNPSTIRIKSVLVLYGWARTRTPISHVRAELLNSSPTGSADLSR